MTNRKIKVVIGMALLCVVLCLVGVISQQFGQLQIAFAEQTKSMNITTTLTGINSSSYFKFNDRYNANGYNNVGNYFSGSLVQKNSGVFIDYTLTITCSDTKAISSANNGDYYYSSDYKVSADSKDEKALILVFGSNKESDYQGLLSYANKSSTELKGTVIKSDKTITRDGKSSVTLEFNTGFDYIWYQIVYQWTQTLQHNNSYLVAGQSEIIAADRTAPTGTLIGVNDGGITNSDVRFTWSEENCSATLNGNSYSSNSNISAEGRHTIELTDAVGNANRYYFTIDKTKPTLSCSDGVALSSYTNKLATVSASDTYFSKLYYKQPDWTGWSSVTSKSFKISAVNGLWQFYATDTAGNQSDIFSFTYDNVAPEVGMRKADGTAFADGAWVNQGVYFDVKDSVGMKSTKLYEQIGGNWQVINGDYISGSIYFDNRNPGVLYGSRQSALNAIIDVENNRLKSKSNWETIANDNRIIAPGQIDYVMNGADYWEYATSNGEIYVFFIQSDINEFIRSRATNYLGSSARDMFQKEGYFKIEGEDIAGNVTSKTFRIKLTAPTLEIEPSGYANKIRYKVTDESGLTTYVKVDNGEWIRQDGNDLTFGPEHSDGTYYFKTIDAAGNTVTASVVLDTTAPTLMLKKNGNIVISDLYVNARDIVVFAIEDKNSAGRVELDGVEYSSLPAVSTLSDGLHEIFALDKAGNKSTAFRFIVDNVAPTLSIEELDGTAILQDETSLGYYTNEAVRFASEDPNFAFLCVYLNDSLIYKENAVSIDFPAIETNFGTYRIYAEDLAGNRSEEKLLIMQVISDFGNLQNAYKSFKINAWYEVTLPAYIFGTSPTEADISGRYSFERYDDAYSWSLAMEERYRVQKVSNGWIYVSATNESVSQVYTAREDLNKVLIKYASRYVSARKVASSSGNDNYYTIKDEDGRNDEYAFVRQSLTLPGYMFEYKDYELLQIRSAFAYKRTAAALAPTFTTLTYLADDFALQENKTIRIYPGTSIKEALESNNMYKQGYYLVNEQDLCGNSQKYVVYIDIESPKIRAEIEQGDSTKKEVIFDKDFAEDNANVFYYLSFRFDVVLDNVDKFTTVKIEGRGLTNAIFVQGDELPVLDAALGGGQYTITVYDRSCNVFQFKVNIANKEPTMEYNSLRPTNRQLTLYFATNDNLNQIVRLEIYKINGAGERILIEQDDLGKQIDFTSLEYNFTTGGKFFAVITDRYGRVIETEPIFYERGLPNGNLTTTAGSITNKDVYFTYAVGNGVVVYTYDETGKEVIYTDYLIEYDNLNKEYSLGFLAGEGVERQFMIHLYNESDDNLYMEYKFGIDTVIAVVNVVDSNNVAVEKGGYTNQSFSLNWTEANVRVKYTIGSSAISATYARGDALSGNGMYTFTVTDRVGNTETFTIYLDNVVDYTLDGGKIVNVGGRYLTNSPVALTINEMISEWKVADGKEVINGVPITEEGIYSVTVSDRYGNTITIVIELDITPPEMVLNGVIESGATKDEVIVTFEDGAKGYLMKGNTVIREIKSGEIFTDHGNYAVRAEDLAGNIVNMKFTIDRKVDFASNIINRQITTESVVFALSEEGSIEIIKDGQAADIAKNYSESGRYVLTATDAVGNALVFTFTILPKNAQSLNIELDAKQIVSLSKFNGEDVKLDYSDDTKKNIVLDKTGRYTLTISDIEQNQSYTVYLNIDNVAPNVELIWSKNTVSFSRLNKDGVTAKFTKDGEEIAWSQSSVAKDPGHYVLELSDEFGNVNVIEWDIKYKLNGLSIALIVVGCIAVIGVVVLIIAKRLKVKVS